MINGEEYMRYNALDLAIRIEIEGDREYLSSDEEIVARARLFLVFLQGEDKEPEQRPDS